MSHCVYGPLIHYYKCLGNYKQHCKISFGCTIILYVIPGATSNVQHVWVAKMDVQLRGQFARRFQMVLKKDVWCIPLYGLYSTHPTVYPWLWRQLSWVQLKSIRVVIFNLGIL